MALDDPAQCCQVKQYQGPGFDSLRFSDSKLPLDLHQNYLKAKQILENSLDGYCPWDEKFFKEYIGAIIKDYLTFLHDPRLPLDETREALASIQGRIQPKLEKDIQRALSNYEQNLTSVLAQFPSNKINNAILDYLSKIDHR